MRNQQPVRPQKRAASAKKPRPSAQAPAKRRTERSAPPDRASAAARRRNAARIKKLKQQRRKKIIRTVLIILLVLAAIAGLGALGFMAKDLIFKEPVQTFQAANEFSGSGLSGNEGRAATFASDLCVISEDQPLDSVSLDEGQEGILLNLSDKEVLYSKGAYTKVYPASITKIMTALLAFRYNNMDEVVTITQENVTLEEGSQVIGFQAGDKVTMDELVHGLLVYSGNDAASAIATQVGGSTEKFVEMMNSYARELGCTGTNFTNPHGLQDENHYTTPYDIYLILKEALKYPEFTEITQMGSYTITYERSWGEEVSTALTATDHYLTGEASAPKGITILGGKTGTTSDAGNCLALLSQNAYGEPYVSVVMGASTKELLYQQMSSLLENANIE